ncbi:hypothetical protein AQPE_0086 [Aquipluma nitroreducens]|uniref:Uncharacterized protein n=1 Tax=Aquipluma nitroreducens TaxID=2010828 RepID=A0A5K7S3A1_9BACT|nr:hypothetical protein AQPE_0086 [Aquipluma nitroreducens]
MAPELHDIRNTPNNNDQTSLFNVPVFKVYPTSADKAMGKEIRTLPSSSIIFIQKDMMTKWLIVNEKL